MNWDFLQSDKKDKVNNFEHYYFMYYVFDVNITMSLIISLLLEISTFCQNLSNNQSNCSLIIFIIISLLSASLFAYNAVSLRSEMCDFTNKP